MRDRFPAADGCHIFDRAAAVLAEPLVSTERAMTGAEGLPTTVEARPVATGEVTVVIPTHNDGPNIGALVGRLLDEPDVGEILVIASACDDETVPTVLEASGGCDGKIRLYLEAERSGKVAAINFGLGEVGLPYAVVISGDVLPEPNAIPRLLEALRRPGVGLVGGRPVPVNPESQALGHAVHLLWRLHHRLALHQPKLGEMIGLRTEAIVALPRTSVDEACFQALLETSGWNSVYVPDAVVLNRGPGTVRDFFKQRRQIHAGHLWLRHRQHYTVPSLRPGLLVSEMWRDLNAQRERLRPRRLAWTAGAVAMEAGARLMARLDYMRGRENHVWDMVKSTKAPALDADGLRPRGGQLVAGQGVAETAPDQRDGEHELPVQLQVPDVQRLRPEGQRARR